MLATVRAGLVGLCVLATAAVGSPVQGKQGQDFTAGGVGRGGVATVDLTDPTVEIVVTERTGNGGNEATLTRTDAWRTQVGAQLAINANFYASLGGGQADIVGLSATDGVVVSPARTFNGVPDPSVVIPEDGPARVGRFSGLGVGEIADAVAGVGRSTTDADPGTLLVDDGVNLGATARVQPASRNPRTAIGVSEDGNTLILAVVDGRQAGWSVGMTLPELADLMIREGAHDAVNLDGGGSSSFVYESPTGDVVQNRPSDGGFRSVANHIGVKIGEASTAVPAGARRPIRGVWLRPPSSSAAQFEAYCEVLAGFGITDVFLETFYWGLATHDSDVFNDRFSYDYLEAAILSAAKHGVRVHAWLEAGYWSFSGTGNYLFAQDPTIAVVNNVDPTKTGDINGQVFVNLGHPFVQGKLFDLCAELSEYPGLWGIQTDYHRFPANAGNNQGPWSFDAWARSEFQSIYGVDPLFSASGPGALFWDEFTAFRRDGVSQAANVMHQAINASSNPGIAFSGAIFASAMTNASQFSKMQNWPEWAENGYLEWIVPMAYSTSTTGIRNDIQTTNNSSFGRRVVAGLAILTNTSRPTVAQQLAAIQQRGVEDFILFDAPTLIANASMQQDLASWLAQSATVQVGDFNSDRWIDARDLAQFDSLYSGTPIPVNGLNARFDLNDDDVIDDGDREALLDIFRAFRFGEDGEVDELDLAVFEASMTGPGAGGAPVYPLHLFDLDADNDVDYDDQLILHSLKTKPLAFETDLDGDGTVDVEDMYVQRFAQRDVNRDGVVDDADFDDLEAVVRADERLIEEAGRPR